MKDDSVERIAADMLIAHIQKTGAVSGELKNVAGEIAEAYKIIHRAVSESRPTGPS